MGFSTPSYDLDDLFNRIDRGDLQLPDFQRSFRWTIDDIRSLLLTVLRGYPIGAIMALDTRNETPRFKSRPIKGAPDTGEAPGLLLLDGQQRITTLYQCLRGDGLVRSVDARDKKVERRFYVDVRKAVSAPVLPEEAIISTDKDGNVLSHFADDVPTILCNRATELAAGLVPVHVLLSDEGTDMLFDLADGSEPGFREVTKAFNNKVLKPLAAYQVPMIRLDRETARSGIAAIFAHANASGLQMDVFELMTSVFKLENADFDLLRDWAHIESQLRQYPALDDIDKTQFLSAVALYHTFKKGKADGHREAILSLNLADYRRGADAMIHGFAEAAKFMRERCIINTRQVPNNFQLVPLAVIIALLNEHGDVLIHRAAWDRLNQWFWNCVFGELYAAPSAVVRAAIDVDQVVPWVLAAAGVGSDTETPRSVQQAQLTESRLLSAGPDSGLYKGIFALIMGRGARDWRTAQPFNADTYEDLGTNFRPVFPTRWCHEHGISDVLANSVLNRTPMGRRTWVVADGNSPARYAYRLQSKSMMDDQQFDEVVSGHLINPKFLLSADAQQYFSDRRQQMVTMIEQAMGKAAIRDVDEDDLHSGAEGPAAFEVAE